MSPTYVRYTQASDVSTPLMPTDVPSAFCDHSTIRPSADVPAVVNNYFQQSADCFARIDWEAAAARTRVSGS